MKVQFVLASKELNIIIQSRCYSFIVYTKVKCTTFSIQESAYDFHKFKSLCLDISTHTVSCGINSCRLELSCLVLFSEVFRFISVHVDVKLFVDLLSYSFSFIVHTESFERIVPKNKLA